MAKTEVELAQVENNNICEYCNQIGKYKKRFQSILCDRHYRQLLKYGHTIKTSFDNNEYYAVIQINNRNIFIDIEDIEKCKKYKWRIHGNKYVFTKIDGKDLYLHQFIMGTDKTVDHINHNVLDNRKSNLRIANKSKNMMNSKVSSKNTSGVKGVSFDSTRGQWASSIYKNGKIFNLGRFNNFHDAVYVRFKKEIELFQEFSTYYDIENKTYKMLYEYNNKLFCIQQLQNCSIEQFEVLLAQE